jgi:UDP-glucuronate 4-epimerase
VQNVVTGAAGFVGSACAHGLLDTGAEVVGVDRLGSDEPRLHRAWATLTGRSRFTPVVADLAEDDLKSAVAGADAVIHLAGRGGTHSSWSEYGAYLRDNVGATARIAQACIDADVPRLVHVSSSSVYGRLAIGDEDQALEPVSPYGVSKLAAEHTVTAYARELGLRAVLVRMFSVYGPGQRPDMGVYRLIAAALWDTPFVQHGDGRQRRSMTYVDDVIAGIELALCAGADGAVYNLGGAAAVSLNEVVDEVGRLVGRPLRPRVGDDPPGNQRHTEADFSRATEELGYTPKVSVRDGLARQLAWQRSLAGPDGSPPATAG